MIIIREFILISLVSGVCFALIFSIYGGEIPKAVMFGLLGGLISGLVMSVYLSCILLLFKKRLFFYRNVDDRLNEVGVKQVVFAGIAGNATRGRIKYGGLFLSDDFVVFIPQRFALKPALVKLPLDAIVGVKTTGLNLLKLFSGGLRRRLLIETKDSVKYEFSVWELDKWVKEITARIKR